eukprot:scaffold5009_cov21-Tisochrysis_lutea.AAC.2
MECGWLHSIGSQPALTSGTFFCSTCIYPAPPAEAHGSLSVLRLMLAFLKLNSWHLRAAFCLHPAWPGQAHGPLGRQCALWNAAAAHGSPEVAWGSGHNPGRCAPVIVVMWTCTLSYANERVDWGLHYLLGHWDERNWACIVSWIAALAGISAGGFNTWVALSPGPSGFRGHHLVCIGWMSCWMVLLKQMDV